MDFVVFDVDGTLIDDSQLAGEENLYLHAVEKVLGVKPSSELDHYRFKTDAGILNQILDEYGFQPQEAELHEQVKSVLFDLLKQQISQSAFKWKAMKGAKSLLEDLKSKNQIFAIATGSWAPIARLRLDSIGLSIGQIHISSSENGESKYLILQHAINALSNRYSAKPSKVTYIGDHPEDMQACDLLGIEFCGIGTLFKSMDCYQGNDLTRIVLG